MILQYIVLSLVIGFSLGWLMGRMAVKRKISAETRARKIRSINRQKKILNHFRIEVKNNTIRLKKEKKRLALSKKLAQMDLLFRQFNKRLHRVSDKELRHILKDYYRGLIALNSVNEAFIAFAEKNIQPNEKLEAEVIALFYNSITAAVLQMIEKIVETGPVLVGIIEEKLGDM